MSPEEVLRRVDVIRESSGDDEGAHGMEDSLWSDVLRAISDGTADDPAGCAKAALLTQEIDFSRWCA